MLVRTLSVAEPLASFILLQPGSVNTQLGKDARKTIPGLPAHVVDGTPASDAVREMLRVIAERGPSDTHLAATCPARAARPPSEQALSLVLCVCVCL